jgi:hypothetical protein
MGQLTGPSYSYSRCSFTPSTKSGGNSDESTNQNPVPTNRFYLFYYHPWTAISTALSVHPLISLFGMYKRHEGLLALFSYFTIFFIAVRFAPIEKYRRLLAGLVVISLISGLYGLLQKFPFLPFIKEEVEISAVQNVIKCSNLFYKYVKW